MKSDFNHVCFHCQAVVEVGEKVSDIIYIVSGKRLMMIALYFLMTSKVRKTWHYVHYQVEVRLVNYVFSL
ncbi:hypothetical protein CS535_22705 [Yersinia massiliensis]|nr:hypothetical protein CS535_22705 [Yersinia massiliensis]